VYDERAAELASREDHELIVDPTRPPYPNREHVDFLTYAFQQLAPLGGKRVLEVGCGSGTLGTYVALQGAHVTGVDVSDEMLAVARRRAQVNGVDDRTDFRAVPVESLDLPDGSFDAVIGNQVLHHFELEDAMANLRRLLVPGGRAVFCEPVLFLPDAFRKIRNGRAVARRFPVRTDTPDERSLGLAEMRTIRDAFDTSEMKCFQLSARLQNFVDLSDSWFARLQRFDTAALRIGPAQRLCRYVVLTLDTAPNVARTGRNG
jgi:2-polyprenyl-3-methyl-5-hydroxy-6-metoxy-1,4-benzoquinol methylase